MVKCPLGEHLLPLEKYYPRSMKVTMHPNSRSKLVCPVDFLSCIASKAISPYKNQHKVWVEKEYLALSYHLSLA